MSSSQYVTFYLKEDLYAVPVESVREILRLPPVTPLPLAPAYVEGLANLRGEILPVVDLRSRLGMERLAGEERKVLVLDRGGKPLGVVVDRTDQVLRIEEDRVERGGCEEAGRFVAGVIRHEGALLMLLDVPRILEGKKDDGSSGGTEGRIRLPEEERILEAQVQVVVLELGEQAFAFPIENVREIVRYAEPTAIPEALPWVRGIFELRGKILTVLDLRARLGIEAVPPDEFTKILVLASEGRQAGFVVDRVREVLRLPQSRVVPPPGLVKRANEGIRGIIERDRETLLLLDGEVLLPREGGGEEVFSGQEILSEEDRRTLVVFTLEGQEYGVPIEGIREIGRVGEVTRIPGAPAFVEGISNLRGEVLPVIDLRRKFGMGTGERDFRTRILVAEEGGRTSGFVVDSVIGVERTLASLVRPALMESSGGEGAEFLAGVVSPAPGRTILLLDLGKLLSEGDRSALDRAVSGGAESLPGTEISEAGTLPPVPAEGGSVERRRLKRSR
jgi:purine-binding chemotaxis protein CheW